jgi:hypothetical protein
MGTAIDMSNLWLHKYRASTAATAACESGAADMLWAANNSPTQFATSSAGFMTASTGGAGGQVSGNCSSSSPNVAMCAYARANGYDPADTSRQVDVVWVLSSTGPSNAQTTPPSLPNGVLPYLRVAVSENVKTYMLGLIPGFHSPVKVTGFCDCGLVSTSSESANYLPMISLSPNLPVIATYAPQNYVVIGGGPIAWEFSSSTGFGLDMYLYAWNSSQGGPTYDGSSIAVYDPNFKAPSGEINEAQGPSFGKANPALSRLSSAPTDPFASVPPPASVKGQTPLIPIQKIQAGYLSSQAVNVAYGEDGCPDTRGCQEISPGYYPGGLIEGIQLYGATTTLFLPGIYYLDSTPNVADTVKWQSSNMGIWGGRTRVYRVATPCAPKCGQYTAGMIYQQTDGVTLYFHRGSWVSGWLQFSGTSDPPLDNIVDPMPSSRLTCDGSTPDARSVPSSITGSALYGPCTKNGSYVDSTDNSAESVGSVRGMVVFFDRDNRDGPINQTTPGLEIAPTGPFVFAGVIYNPNGVDYFDPEYPNIESPRTPFYVLGDIVDAYAFLGSIGTQVMYFTPNIPSGSAASSALKIATFSSN